MKKRAPTFIIIGLILIITAIVISQTQNDSSNLNTNNEGNNTPTEENNSLFPIRTTPETSTTRELTTEQGVTSAIGEKFNKHFTNISVEVTTDTGMFAKGTVTYKDESGTDVWYAAYSNDRWELAVDGRGVIECESVNKYNFPKDMVPVCIDTRNNNATIKR